MEEERRLAFVAVTRAEKELFLSEAEGRNLDASPRYPSRFLLDIDQELLAFTAPPREGLIRDARDYIAASEKFMPEEAAKERFTPGSRVRHEILGSGTVVEIDRDKGAYVIQFDSMKTARRISFRVKLDEEFGIRDSEFGIAGDGRETE